jgi:hypothetical protein
MTDTTPDNAHAELLDMIEQVVDEPSVLFVSYKESDGSNAVFDVVALDGRHPIEMLQTMLAEIPFAGPVIAVGVVAYGTAMRYDAEFEAPFPGPGWRCKTISAVTPEGYVSRTRPVDQDGGGIAIPDSQAPLASVVDLGAVPHAMALALLTAHAQQS